MNIRFRLNGKDIQADVEPDVVLLGLIKELGCYSVRRGCETTNCGLYTVWLDGEPIPSCSTPTVHVSGRHMTALEGLQKRAEGSGMLLVVGGRERRGFCSPGFVMNMLAMEKEPDHPDEDEVREYLSGNLCRYSGYISQLQAVKQYLGRGNGVGGDI